MNKPKIAFLIRQLGLGGTERRMLDLYAALSLDYDIKIIAITGEDEYHNVNPDQSSGSNRKNYFQKLVYLHRELKSFNPDIIHAFDVDSGIYAKIALLLWGKKMSIISGMGAELIASKLIRNLLRIKFLQPELFVCNSKAGATYINNTYQNKINTQVIANGIDPGRFLGNDSLPKPDWHVPGRPVIGYIGKMDEYKHGERVADIAHKMITHPLNPVFVVIGTGPYLDSCRKKIESFSDLKKNIVLLGSVDNAARLIRYFTIGILCSDKEGFPNVLLEYMASGVPIVSTSPGDIAYILDEGKAGVILQEYNDAVFADAISTLLLNINQLNTFSTLAKKRFNSLFTIEIMKNKYNNLYQNLLHQKHVPSQQQLPVN